MSTYRTELVASQHILTPTKPKGCRVKATVLLMDEIPPDMHPAMKKAVHIFPEDVRDLFLKPSKSGELNENLKVFLVVDDSSVNHGGIKSPDLFLAENEYLFDMLCGCRNREAGFIIHRGGFYELNDILKYIKEEDLLAVKGEFFCPAEENSSTDIISLREKKLAQFLFGTNFSVFTSHGNLARVQKRFEQKSAYLLPPNLPKLVVQLDKRISDDDKEKIINESCTDGPCRWDENELFNSDPLYNLVYIKEEKNAVELYFKVQESLPIPAKNENEEMGPTWGYSRVSSLLSHKESPLGRCCIAPIILALVLGISSVHPNKDPTHILSYGSKRKVRNGDEVEKENGSAMIRISSVLYANKGQSIDTISQQNKYSLGEADLALQRTGVQGKIYPSNYSFKSAAKEIAKDINKTMNSNIETVAVLAQNHDVEKLEKIRSSLTDFRTL